MFAKRGPLAKSWTDVAKASTSTMVEMARLSDIPHALATPTR
jgi:hypothetical protein